MSELPPRILVIDSERHQLDTVCRGLHLHGYCCQGALGVEAALDALAGGIDLVIIDLTMPGGSGLDLIEHVRKQWPDLPMVVITGLGDEDRAKDYLTLQKPFDPEALDATVRQALVPHS